MGGSANDRLFPLTRIGRLAIVVGIATILTFAWMSGMQKISNSQAAAPVSGNLITAPQRETSQVITLYIATDANFWPFEYISGTQLVGHDIDLMNAIGLEISATIVYTIVQWEDIFNGLIAGKYDGIIDGLTVTPGREELIDFTIPYMAYGDEDHLAIAVQQGDHQLRRQFNDALWQLRIKSTLGTIISNVDSDLPDSNARLPDWTTTTVYSDTESTLIFTATHGSPTIIQFPIGAVTETIELLYTPVYTVTVPPGYSFLDHAFELDAYLDESELLPTLAFNQPVTVTINYTDTMVIGLDESSLVLWRWDETMSDWEDAACGAYDYHPEDNWLAVPICHLSRFALFEGGHTIYLPLVHKSQ